VFTTYDAETFSAPDCLTVVGWYRKALEMCGVKGVKIVEEECRAKGGAVCRYRVSWD
jgi:predicted hydrocarbon binding protein